jgi:hypothetical protein
MLHYEALYQWEWVYGKGVRLKEQVLTGAYFREV